jgi:anti-sigma-K factor RskA
MIVDDTERLWRFLLGEATEEDRGPIEERLLVDDEQALVIDSAESDLIDAYVRGELSVERRRRFEDRYLVTPVQRSRVAFAEALAAQSRRTGRAPSAEGGASHDAARGRRGPHEASARRTPRARRAWRMAGLSAAAAFALALGGIGLLLENRWRPTVADELTLGASQVRGESDLPTIRARGRGRLHLTLLLQEAVAKADRSFDVTLRREDEAARAFPVSVAGDGKSLSLALDEEGLRDGTYELIARVQSGAGAPAEIASYAFRVVCP